MYPVTFRCSCGCIFLCFIPYLHILYFVWLCIVSNVNVLLIQPHGCQNVINVIWFDWFEVSWYKKLRCHSQTTRRICANAMAWLTTCTCIMEPPKLGCIGPRPLAVGAQLTPYKYAPPPAEFGRYRSNDTSVIKEIRLKNLIHRVPPFKVSQCYRNWHGSIRHRWLPINVP